MQKITDEIDKISCIIGGKNIVSAIYQDLSIKSFAVSLRIVEEEVHQFYFERIGYCALINTKHLSSVTGKRVIQLRNGIRFKVSRKKWELFKNT